MVHYVENYKIEQLEPCNKMVVNLGQKDKQWPKTLKRKLKIKQHKPHWKPGWTQVHRKGKEYLLH
jgi:hypothetical protein